MCRFPSATAREGSLTAEKAHRAAGRAAPDARLWERWRRWVVLGTRKRGRPACCAGPKQTPLSKVQA